MTYRTEKSVGLTRRTVITAAATGIIASALPWSARAQASGDRKILTVFFSRTGNTSELARMVNAKVGGDLVRLQTVDPYPQEYRVTADQAKREQEEGFRPALANRIEGIEDYDTVFLGYPIWWASVAMPVFTFLETYDLSNKTIIPFCSHEGSRFGRSVSDIQTRAPGTRILEGFETRGASDGSIRTSGEEPEIASWLTTIGFPG